MAGTRHTVLRALEHLGDATAKEVADLCGLDARQVAVVLLRCTRNSLVYRRRSRPRPSWLPGPSRLYCYSLTDPRGVERLDYWDIQEEYRHDERL